MIVMRSPRLRARPWVRCRAGLASPSRPPWPPSQRGCHHDRAAHPDIEPARRTAILVAQTTELETRIADATLAVFEKYIGSLFSKAQNRDERRFQAVKRDVANALLLFHRTIAALRHAQETGEDDVTVVDREVGMRRLHEALPIIGAVAEVADQDILITAAERSPYISPDVIRIVQPF